MALSVRDGGDWKLATPYVRDGGDWKPVVAAYVHDGGDWKLAYGATDWEDIAGSFDAENGDVVMPFADDIGVSVTTNFGGGALYFTLNETPVAYSAPFSVSAGDTLRWGAQTKGSWNATVEIYRLTGPTLIDTFNISLT